MARTVFSFGRYRLNVVPGPNRQFLWVLREAGVDVHRSATLFASEDKAGEDGLAALVRMLGSGDAETLGPRPPKTA